MRKNLINEVHLEGFLYDCDLQSKVTGQNSQHPNTPYISGSVTIATDPELLNTVDIFFRYVGENTKNGTSATYALLSKIMNGAVGTVMRDGSDKASRVVVNSSLNVNEFYSNRTGSYELVSNPRIEQGFIQLQDNLSTNDDVRNKFKCDVIIESVAHVDGDEDNQTVEKGLIKGYIFDTYRKTILPMTFTAYDPGAIAYFEGLEVSVNKPAFTTIWGKNINTTVVTTITQESAFGAPSIQEVKKHRREFVITGANPDIFPWDDESTITNDEYVKLKQDRDLYIATLKKDTEERNAAKASNPTPSAFGNNTPPAFNSVGSSEFKF